MVKKSRNTHPYLKAKLIVAALGLILSVLLHELFHIWMHWGEIVSIRVFTGFSITEIVVIERTGYDIDGEEFAAYLITILVLILTTIVIYRIHDSADTRTVRQILFAKDNSRMGMKSAEFLKLARHAGIAPPDMRETKSTRMSSRQARK